MAAAIGADMPVTEPVGKRTEPTHLAEALGELLPQERPVLVSNAADMRHQVIEDLVDLTMPPKSYPDAWDSAGLVTSVRDMLNMELPIAAWAAEEGVLPRNPLHGMKCPLCGVTLVRPQVRGDLQ